MKFVSKFVIGSMLLMAGLVACSSQSTKNVQNQSQVAPATQQSQSSTVSSSSVQTQTDNNSNQVPVTFVRDVDGDTIKVMYQGKEVTVRYLLMDTSEDKKANTCVQPYSLEAAKRNTELLQSGNVTLEFDHGNRFDKYGRLLAYVYVNGKSVQETLIREGYARVAYIYQPPYKHLAEYEADQQYAKSKGLRIWSIPGFVTSRGYNGCVDTSTKK